MWKLLKELGYETGEYPEYFRHQKAEAKKGNIPYIVKGTHSLCNRLSYYVDRYNLQVDHIIVAIRGLEANVKSRTKMAKHRRPYKDMTPDEIGTHFRTAVPMCVGHLILSIEAARHPYTIVMFPRTAQDVDYCYEKVTQAMGDIPYEKFVKAWNKVVKPKLIRNEVP
jgi:hypothetical protein